jgi:hypothetical protein
MQSGSTFLMSLGMSGGQVRSAAETQRDEMALHLLAYNRTRVVNILGIQPFIPSSERSGRAFLVHRASKALNTPLKGDWSLIPPAIN